MDKELSKDFHDIIITPKCPQKATFNLKSSSQSARPGPSGSSMLASTGDDIPLLNEGSHRAARIAFIPAGGTPYNFIITDKHGNSCSRLALEVGEDRSLISASLVQDLGADSLPVPPSVAMKSQPTLTGTPLENFAVIEADGSKTTISQGKTLRIGILEHGHHPPGIDIYIGGKVQRLFGKIMMLRRAGPQEVNGPGDCSTDPQHAEAAHKSTREALDTSILTLSSASVRQDGLDEAIVSRAFHGVPEGGLSVPSPGMQCLKCFGSMPPPNSLRSNSAGGGTSSSRCDLQNSSPPTSIAPDSRSFCSCESSASVINSEAPGQVKGSLRIHTQRSVPHSIIPHVSLTFCTA